MRERFIVRGVALYFRSIVLFARSMETSPLKFESFMLEEIILVSESGEST